MENNQTLYVKTDDNKVINEKCIRWVNKNKFTNNINFFLYYLFLTYNPAYSNTKSSLSKYIEYTKKSINSYNVSSNK